AFMRRAAVFVLPSHHEGMALAVLEAMMRGLPVITTAVGEHASIIHDGIEGLLIPPGDTQTLARAIARLLSDRQLATRLGDAARSRALREFEISANHRAVANVYSGLIGQSKASAIQM